MMPQPSVSKKRKIDEVVSSTNASTSSGSSLGPVAIDVDLFHAFAIAANSSVEKGKEKILLREDTQLHLSADARGPSRPDVPLHDPEPLLRSKRVDVDLVGEVRGRELSDIAPDVKWNNGTFTLLPFIPGKKGGNLLSSEEEAVRTLARLAQRSCAFPFVRKIETSIPSFVDRCRELLSCGSTLLVRGYQPPKSPTPSLTEAYLRDTMKLNTEFAMYESHNASLRAKDFPNPYKQLSLRDFVKGIHDHQVVHCILSLSSRTVRVPDFIQDDLDDSYASFVHDNPDLFRDDDEYDKIYRDSIETRTWNLLHGAGYHTLAHKDGDGLGTWVIINSGVKMWCIIRPGQGYTQAKSFPDLYAKTKVMTAGLQRGFERDWEATNPEVALLQLDAGDLLIMPPGTWHEVYTPIQGIASGGHYLSYDTMHLTAFSRRHDFREGLNSTNDNHPPIYRTLCRMMIDMARMTNRTFYRKPVIAHCSMIIAWNEYIHVGQSPEAHTQDSLKLDCRLAHVIAKAVLRHLGIPDVKEEYELFFEGETWMSTGPVVDLSRAFSEFDGTVLRPRSGVKIVGDLDHLVKRFEKKYGK